MSAYSKIWHRTNIWEISESATKTKENRPDESKCITKLI